MDKTEATALLFRAVHAGNVDDARKALDAGVWVSLQDTWNIDKKSPLQDTRSRSKVPNLGSRASAFAGRQRPLVEYGALARLITDSACLAAVFTPSTVSS
jgi:hypothetical protein